MVGVRHQGGLVHEKGLNVGEMGAQLVKDGKAMGVDVAPVKNVALKQPLGLGQYVKAVTRTKNDQAVGHRRKGQEVDFVFSDKHPTHPRHSPAQLLKRDLRDGDVRIACTGQQRQGGVEQAQANSQRLVFETITAGEPRDTCGTPVNLVQRQGEVQQLGQHSSVRLDEFAVYPGQIHLAQVDTGSWMGAYPSQHPQ